MKRRVVLLVPLIPAIALLTSVWLPFVNTARLWFGVPSVFVWISAWVLLIPAALAVVEWGPREEQDGDQQ